MQFQSLPLTTSGEAEPFERFSWALHAQVTSLQQVLQLLQDLGSYVGIVIAYDEHLDSQITHNLRLVSSSSDVLDGTDLRHSSVLISDRDEKCDKELYNLVRWQPWIYHYHFLTC